ncbi:MAG: DUF2953 domain-containing protein [Firmicutes bacterium]|nr:DUF2953 domain-containing protein [Bacillota bacterium]
MEPWLAALALGGLIALLYIPVRFTIFYRWHEGQVEAEVKLGVFKGWPGFRWLMLVEQAVDEPPAPDFHGSPVERWKVFRARAGKAGRLYRREKGLIDYYLTRLRFLELSWRTEVGFTDAAVTAWAAGVLWTAKGTALAVLQNKASLRGVTPRIAVVPNYRRNMMDSEFRSIFQLSTGHIIIGTIRYRHRRAAGAR